MSNEDMFSANASCRGRPVVAAFLASAAAGVLLLFSSTPALAVSMFDAKAGIFVKIPDVEHVDVAYPTDNSNLFVETSYQTTPVASAAVAGDASFDPGSGDAPARLGAYAEASGSADTGSATASAFASSWVLLQNLSSDYLDLQILFDDDIPYDFPAFVNLTTVGDASAQGGWLINLFLRTGESESLVGSQSFFELFAEDDVTQIGWLAILDPGAKYRLEISAAARGAAGSAVVPEPGSLALLGLGLAGLSLSRRRKVR